MQSPDQFETARMAAGRIRENDFDDLCRMDQNPRVMATMGGLRPEAETRGFLRNGIDHWEQHGYGIWIFRGRNDGGFIGRAGLRNIVIDAHPEIELLYAVMPEFWRAGLATEMSHAILQIAPRLGITQVVAFTLHDNRGSRGVMEKAGLRYERDIVWASLPHVLYRIELGAGPMA
jgi:RimJ/RimL family protein N-acetyltransferase